MSSKSITASILWDRFGLAVSTICAIHCLFLPVSIALMPLLAIPVYSEWVHPIFILLIAPTVYFAAKRSHFNRSITLQLVSGLVLITVGWLVGHYWLGFWVETAATLAGSALLIRGHWRNYRHHQLCTIKSHRHHPVVDSTGDNPESTGKSSTEKEHATV
ncbi:MAG: MerC domain-containing protein [Balneolaceae bacterium]